MKGYFEYMIKDMIRNGISRMGLYSTVRKLYWSLFKKDDLSQYKQNLMFYSELLPSSSLCFDVGANMGEKTILLLEAGAKKVVAFEPQQECITAIKSRYGTSYNGRLATVDMVLGAQMGDAILYLGNRSSTSSMDKTWESSSPNNQIKVKMTTLDGAITKFGRPDYCKIDVEGWELEVLKGLSQPIPLLSFEYHLWEQELEKTLNCLDYLSGFGDILINITSDQDLVFALQKWLPLKEFLKVFPDQFYSRREFRYGDIFVRTMM